MIVELPPLIAAPVLLFYPIQFANNICDACNHVWYRKFEKSYSFRLIIFVSLMLTTIVLLFIYLSSKYIVLFSQISE